MPDRNKPHLKFDHDEYAKTRPLDDFWGQIRRTVQGVPVADDQIRMITDAIKAALQLQRSDILLDLACGNGALSQLLFESCSGLLGVDLSDHLISVAKSNFEVLPRYRFVRQSASDYVRTEPSPDQFSKVLCYGSFSYFSADDASEVLRTLFKEFRNVQAVYIGNLPDKDRAAEFYRLPPDCDELADCHSTIGIWRTRSEFAQLANEAGWEVKFIDMPPHFYASHYRYDALLTR